jgi:hypothetical protein
MSTVTASQSYVLHTDLGTVIVRQDVVEGFDIEDVVRQRAYSQAMSVKMLGLAKSVNINAPKAPRTIPSTYLQTDEELPS